MRARKEEFAIARLLMVLSSISPLFIFWMIGGANIEGVREDWFLAGCAVMIVFPNIFLYWRLWWAKKQEDTRDIVAGKAEDHRDHLLVYLFAMLLPFYAANMDSIRSFAENISAVVFIVFLFWHLNMHYMNILWAIVGYRVFTVYPPDDTNPFSGKSPYVLITKRMSVNAGDQIKGYRLSSTILFEVRE